MVLPGRVLVKPAGDGPAERVQAELTRAGIVVLTTSPSEPLALARARATTGLKLLDRCTFTTAVAGRLPLVTFDHTGRCGATVSGGFVRKDELSPTNCL